MDYMENIPLATTLYIIVLDAVLLAFFLESLRRAGASRMLRWLTGLGLGLYLLGLIILIEGKTLFPDDIGSTAYFSAILGGVGLFSVLFFLTPLRPNLLAIPQEYLMLLQGLRMFFGAGFLIEASLGFMPVAFGLPDGVCHITSAFLAMKAGLLMLNGTANRWEGWTANLFGLTDIVFVAAGLAFYMLKQVGPHHNVMLAALFAAPIFINIHILSLAKLWISLRTATVKHQEVVV